MATKTKIEITAYQVRERGFIDTPNKQQFFCPGFTPILRTLQRLPCAEVRLTDAASDLDDAGRTGKGRDKCRSFSLSPSDALNGRTRENSRASENRNPCRLTLELCVNHANCSVRSMPSAVTSRPKRAKRSMRARAMAVPRGLEPMPATNLASSFTRDNGNCSSEVREEYPVPKSSSAIPKPCDRKARSAAMVPGPVCSTDSVNSSSMHLAGSRHLFRSRSMDSTNNRSTSWRADMLIATRVSAQPP